MKPIQLFTLIFSFACFVAIIVACFTIDSQGIRIRNMERTINSQRLEIKYLEKSDSINKLIILDLSKQNNQTLKLIDMHLKYNHNYR